MNTTITSLYNEMSRKLEEIALSAENTLQLAERSYQAVENTLRRLKEFVMKSGFTDKQAEIDFFKVIKPMFLKEMIYFLEIFQIEAWKPPVGKQEQLAHYMIGAKKMDLYFKLNNELYTYYRTGSSAHDELYFLRGATQTNLIEAISITDIDSGFSTLYSIQFAKLQAYEQFTNYLYQCMYRLENPESEHPSTEGRSRLVWTDTKTNLIELGYLLFAKKSVNFGNAKLREIMTLLEIAFNIRLGNYQRTFQNMRIRKNRTPYIDAGREHLSKYMDAPDTEC